MLGLRAKEQRAAVWKVKVSRAGDKAPEGQCKCCRRPAEGGVGRVAPEARSTPAVGAHGNQGVGHGVGPEPLGM